MKKQVKILLVLGVLLLLSPLFLYVLITRDFFIRGQILSRISDQIGEPIQVNSIKLSPFSHLSFSGLTVGDAEAPVLEIQSLDCEYDLFSMIGGTIEVSELSVEGVRIESVSEAGADLKASAADQANADGATAALVKSFDAEAWISALPDVDLADVSIRDLRFRSISPSGELTASGFSLNAVNINDSGNTRVDMRGRLRFQNSAGAELNDSSFFGTLKGELAKNGLPKNVDFDIAIADLDGTFKELSLKERKLQLTGHISEKKGKFQIHDFRLEEKKHQKVEAAFYAQGQIFTAPFGVDLTVNADPVHPDFLNLAGTAAGGYGFGNTTPRLFAQLKIDESLHLAASGDVVLKSFTFEDPAGLNVLPDPLDISLVFKADVSGKDGNGAVSVFDFNIDDRGARRASIGLLEPLNFVLPGFGSGSKTGFTSVKITAMSDGFRLNHFRNPVFSQTGIDLKEGLLNMNFVGVIEDFGKASHLNGFLEVVGLELKTGSDSINIDRFEQTLTAKVSDFRKVSLRSADTTLFSRGIVALKVKTSGTCTLTPDYSPDNADFEMELETLDKSVARCLPSSLRDQVALNRLEAGGTASLILSGGGQGITANGRFEVKDCTGKLPGTSYLNSLASSVDFKLNAEQMKTISIQNLSMKLTEKNEEIADVVFEGNFVAEGRSRATLRASRLDLFRLQNMFAESQENVIDTESTPADAPADEPGGLSLKTVDAELSLLLENIFYDQVVVKTCRGKAMLQKGVLSFDPLDLVVNNAPASVGGYVNLLSDPIDYSLQTEIRKLPLNPFANSFIIGPENLMGGNLSKLSFNVSGSGTEPVSIVKGINAEFDCSLDDFSVSSKLKDLSSLPVPIVQLALLPFEAVAELSGILPADMVTESMLRRQQKFSNMLNKTGRIDRINGTVSIKMKDGLLQVKQLRYSHPDFSEVSITGILDYSRLNVGPGTSFADLDPVFKDVAITMKLKSMSRSLKFPVGGTLKNPKISFSVGDVIKRGAEAVLEKLIEAGTEDKDLHSKDLLKSFLGIEEEDE